MRMFVAGGSGVLGRRLVPPLVARGHQKAKRELGWRLRCPSWRQGFRQELS